MFYMQVVVTSPSVATNWVELFKNGIIGQIFMDRIIVLINVGNVIF